MCTHCNKYFINLKRHVDKVHDKVINKTMCDICDKEVDRTRLSEHKRDVHTPPYLPCEHCGKKFKSKKIMRAHIKNLHAELGEIFPCDHCDKEFKVREGLKSHMIIHSVERLFKCNVCNEGFKQNITLKNHRKTHTGEKVHVFTSTFQGRI